jgi:hypothetical protein
MPATMPTTTRLTMKGSCAWSGFESDMLRSAACMRPTGSRRAAEAGCSTT